MHVIDVNAVAQPFWANPHVLYFCAGVCMCLFLVTLCFSAACLIASIQSVHSSSPRRELAADATVLADDPVPVLVSVQQRPWHEPIRGASRRDSLGTTRPGGTVIPSPQNTIPPSGLATTAAPISATPSPLRTCAQDPLSSSSVTGACTPRRRLDSSAVHTPQGETSSDGTAESPVPRRIATSTSVRVEDDVGESERTRGALEAAVAVTARALEALCETLEEAEEDMIARTDEADRCLRVCAAQQMVEQHQWLARLSERLERTSTSKSSISASLHPTPRPSRSPRVSQTRPSMSSATATTPMAGPKLSDTARTSAAPAVSSS